MRRLCIQNHRYVYNQKSNRLNIRHKMLNIHQNILLRKWYRNHQYTRCIPGSQMCKNLHITPYKVLYIRWM